MNNQKLVLSISVFLLFACIVDLKIALVLAVVLFLLLHFALIPQMPAEYESEDSDSDEDESDSEQEEPEQTESKKRKRLISK